MTQTNCHLDLYVTAAPSAQQSHPKNTSDDRATGKTMKKTHCLEFCNVGDSDN